MYSVKRPQTLLKAKMPPWYRKDEEPLERECLAESPHYLFIFFIMQTYRHDPRRQNSIKKPQTFNP